MAYLLSYLDSDNKIVTKEHRIEPYSGDLVWPVKRIRGRFGFERIDYVQNLISFFYSFNRQKFLEALEIDPDMDKIELFICCLEQSKYTTIKKWPSKPVKFRKYMCDNAIYDFIHLTCHMGRYVGEDKRMYKIFDPFWDYLQIIWVK